MDWGEEGGMPGDSVFVGIDVSKAHLDVAISDSDATWLRRVVLVAAHPLLRPVIVPVVIRKERFWVARRLG